MDKNDFWTQIGNLKEVYGEKSYPDSRVKRLWNSFKHLSVGDFASVVDHLITHERYAPMQDKIQEAVDTLERNKQEALRMPGVSMNLEGIPTGETDPAFVKLCKKTLRDFQTGKITKAQFENACNGLDELARTIARKKNQRGMKHTTGLKIRTLISCDGCGMRFVWHGFAGTLTDSRNPRFCPKCLGRYAAPLPAQVPGSVNP